MVPHFRTVSIVLGLLCSLTLLVPGPSRGRQLSSQQGFTGSLAVSTDSSSITVRDSGQTANSNAALPSSLSRQREPLGAAPSLAVTSPDNSGDGVTGYLIASISMLLLIMTTIVIHSRRNLH